MLVENVRSYTPRTLNNTTCSLADLSFAMFEAFVRCGSITALAETLNLPSEFVTERIEAARLCLVPHDSLA